MQSSDGGKWWLHSHGMRVQTSPRHGNPSMLGTHIIARQDHEETHNELYQYLAGGRAPRCTLTCHVGGVQMLDA